MYNSILTGVTYKGHNPYFNRWFSAIHKYLCFYKQDVSGHNPYFNRWFSAIPLRDSDGLKNSQSQSLF